MIIQDEVKASEKGAHLDQSPVRKTSLVSSMQEFKMNAEETALCKSAEQAQLEPYQDAVLKANQLEAITVDPWTKTFDDIKINKPDDKVMTESEDDSVSLTPLSYFKQNFNISSAAVTSVRLGMPSSATAGIINGLLWDLVNAGYLVEEAACKGQQGVSIENY